MFNPSTCFSQPAIWFQLALFWSTNLRSRMQAKVARSAEGAKVGFSLLGRELRLTGQLS
jgi:hypothetical protein